MFGDVFLLMDLVNYIFLPEHLTAEKMNDPKHMSNACKNWKEEHNIKRMWWPSNNPDLASIENLWSIMKIKISEEGPTTITQCVKIIKSIWNKFDIDLARKLAYSMEDRIMDCKINQGN
jgi:hypothetical protein